MIQVSGQGDEPAANEAFFIRLATNKSWNAGVTSDVQHRRAYRSVVPPVRIRVPFAVAKQDQPHVREHQDLAAGNNPSSTILSGCMKTEERFLTFRLCA